MKYVISMTVEVDGTSESIHLAKALRDAANDCSLAKITSFSTVLGAQ